jgi:uncharacterized phage protein gp47/JayE
LQAAIQSRLTADQLRRSDARVYARAFAGTADALYSLIAYKHRQQFVFSCDSEYLDRHGSLYGIYRYGATKAITEITFDVSAGGAVPAGSIVQTEEGVRYVTTEDDEEGVALAKAEQAGVSGNAETGTVVTLVSPIAGVATEAVLSAPAEGGTDVESDANYRNRVLLKMRETPMGGAASDYKIWAEEVPGVTRVWVSGQEEGAGTVTIRFVCDGAEQIIPDATMIAKVQAHINRVKPVTAVAYVRAPTATTVDFVFAGVSPDTDVVKAQIESELRALFAREAAPGVMLPISHIRAAISGAAGELDYTLTTPSDDIVPGTGNIPVLGSITWP